MENARRFVLASRPVGEPKESDLRLEDFAMPAPGPGDVLLRTLYLSLDPYMRGRMSDAKSYAAPVAIGGVMEGGTVSEVVASNNPAFAKGDIVLGRTGWQTHAVSDGASLRKIDPALAPISTAVGVLGMPGMTAYAGLLEVGKPKAGETLVVAAASGAVGSVVGQIAKIKGLRAVGYRRRRRQMPLREGCARLRRVPRSSCARSSGAACRGLSGRHRHLFRECRRSGARRGAAALEQFRAHPDLRHHRALQRHRAAARPGQIAGRCGG